jgi:hypothetical protein
LRTGAAVLGPHHLLKEAFHCGNIALSAEHEFYGLPFLVHGAVEILTRLPDLDVGLVDTVGRTAHLQVLADSLIDLRAITLYPTKDSRVIHVESALMHHLFDIAVR